MWVPTRGERTPQCARGNPQGPGAPLAACPERVVSESCLPTATSAVMRSAHDSTALDRYSFTICRLCHFLSDTLIQG